MATSTMPNSAKARLAPNRPAANSRARFGIARPRYLASAGSSSAGSPGSRKSAATTPAGNRPLNGGDRFAGFIAFAMLEVWQNRARLPLDYGRADNGQWKMSSSAAAAAGPGAPRGPPP